MRKKNNGPPAYLIRLPSVSFGMPLARGWKNLHEGTCFTRRGSQVQALYRPPRCTIRGTPISSRDTFSGSSGTE